MAEARSPQNLRGRVALVTGSTRGIGKATAVAFARHGASVVVTGRSTDETPNRAGREGTIDSVAAEITDLGGDVLAVAADLSKTEEAERLASQVDEHFGRCDILMNNASLSFIGGFLEVPSRRWNPVLTINIMAPVILTEAFLPGMIERGDGRIINVSSGAADTRDSNATEIPMLSYSAAKAAVEALSFGLAGQVAGTGVAVNCLRPTVATESVTRYTPELLDDPTGRFVKPSDYADAMVWLATQPAEFSGNLLDNDDLKSLGGLVQT